MRFVKRQEIQPLLRLVDAVNKMAQDHGLEVEIDSRRIVQLDWKHIGYEVYQAEYRKYTLQLTANGICGDVGSSIYIYLGPYRVWWDNISRGSFSTMEERMMQVIDGMCKELEKDA